MSQEQIEKGLLTGLPEELLAVISSRIPDKNTADSFVLTCHHFHKIYQPQRLLAVLLKSVVHCEFNKVNAILTRYPELLLSYGDIIAPCKRSFEQITAFQYAVWAMDISQLCLVIEGCIPNDQQGYVIRNNLLEQLEQLQSQGITYCVGEKRYYETKFNLVPLIDSLKSYARDREKLSAQDAQERWCAGVGGLQRDLPLSLRYFYCNYGNVTSTKTLRLYNYTVQNANSQLQWNKDLDGLGERFAIRFTRKRGAWNICDTSIAQNDALKLGAFEHGSQHNLELLKQRLQESILAYEQMREKSQLI